jgi:formate dehydrogenase iron-sulfur subunit
MESFVNASHPGNSRTAIASFYHLDSSEISGCACCRGLACFAARNDDPARWQQAITQSPPLYCLGQCFAGPARADEHTQPHAEVHARSTVLLGNVLRGGVRSLADYVSSGGGSALRQTLAAAVAETLAAINDSSLRGRGGAGFPTGRKWRAVADRIASQKYIVANADEGDAGAFSDRVLMENDPFRLIEALLIAGITVGATKGFIYLRREYEFAAKILGDAIGQAKQAGWLGSKVLDSGHAFELELVIGAGSYVCGEETAMLNAIEGRRPEVRLRPPQITQHGLFGQPTLVNNVETLSAIPWIITHGADAYRALGVADNAGTKLLSLNSLFNRPGVYEVGFGISLRDVVEKLGGGLRRGKLKGVMLGGPLAGIIPPVLLDTPLTHEALQSIGCAAGHGGVIAFADDTSIADIVREVFRFGAFESCGKCTPCHLGSTEISRALAGGTQTAERWHALIDALAATSLCGHGRGLAEFALAIERHFGEELRQCFA